MTRQRSPNYPNVSLPDAITRVRKVFDLDRRAPLDREVVAKHMGYSGLSGASDKTIGSIMQYGLLERVGKGELRVSQMAVDIFHPDKPEQRRAALWRAGTSPEVFQQLRERFGGIIPSMDAARSYLVRAEFLERAIEPTISAFTETFQFLEQENATESDGAPSETVVESPRLGGSLGQLVPLEPPPPPPKTLRAGLGERLLADGERILTKGLLSREANFEVIVSGRVGVKEIETLIRKLEIDKGLLAEDGTDADQQGAASDGAG